MDKRSVELHGAIRNFVFELNKLYPNVKPLALYNRLLQSPPESLGITPVQKHINSFNIFLDRYGEEILDKDEIPVDAIIKFNNSERIYIDISKFLRKCNEGDRKSVV